MEDFPAQDVIDLSSKIVDLGPESLDDGELV